PTRGGTRARHPPGGRRWRPASPGRRAVRSRSARPSTRPRAGGTRPARATPACRSCRHLAERPEKAGVLAGMTRAATVLVDDDQHGISVAVVAHVAHELAVPRGFALAPQLGA